MNELILANPQEAIRLTLERDNVYSYYKYCRREFIGDDRNRDPQYLYRVRHFQHVHFSPQDPEWDLLTKLMEGSLRDQYRVETSRKPYLARHDADLKAIHCLPDTFYEYIIPPQYQEIVREREREARELKHLRPVNVGNLQMILSRAKSWRDFKHPWEWVACASILCGRRTQEILWSLTWERRSDYVIYVTGKGGRE